MPKLSRPSPALVVATIALFIAAGGGAWAATKSPSSAVYARATNPKASIASRGPRGPRGATGPSDGFVISVPQQQPLSAGNDTRIAQLRLTIRGSYIVTAAAALAGNAGSELNLASCTLLQNSNPVTSGSASLQPGVAAFDETMTLTAAVSTSDGSNVSLSCNPDGLGFARNVVITAVRVGTLHTETP